MGRPQLTLSVPILFVMAPSASVTALNSSVVSNQKRSPLMACVQGTSSWPGRGAAHPCSGAVRPTWLEAYRAGATRPQNTTPHLARRLGTGVRACCCGATAQQHVVVSVAQQDVEGGSGRGRGGGRWRGGLRWKGRRWQWWWCWQSVLLYPPACRLLMRLALVRWGTAGTQTQTQAAGMNSLFETSTNTPGLTLGGEGEGGGGRGGGGFGAGGCNGCGKWAW